MGHYKVVTCQNIIDNKAIFRIFISIVQVDNFGQCEDDNKIIDLNNISLEDQFICSKIQIDNGDGWFFEYPLQRWTSTAKI
ncbi:18785_t:CDS:2 [Funneliformis geosporum]|nr:18785_t:CDS:2 [Funneliformis geosporum]